MFSGGIDKQHLAVMGYIRLILLISVPPELIPLNPRRIRNKIWG